MLTIKAYAHDGSVLIIEATQISIAADRKSLRAWEPQNTHYSVFEVGTNERNDNHFSALFIENESGKTIESLNVNKDN